MAGPVPTPVARAARRRPPLPSRSRSTSHRSVSGGHRPRHRGARPDARPSLGLADLAGRRRHHPTRRRTTILILPCAARIWIVPADRSTPPHGRVGYGPPLEARRRDPEQAGSPPFVRLIGRLALCPVASERARDASPVSGPPTRWCRACRRDRLQKSAPPGPLLRKLSAAPAVSDGAGLTKISASGRACRGLEGRQAPSPVTNGVRHADFCQRTVGER